MFDLDHIIDSIVVLIVVISRDLSFLRVEVNDPPPTLTLRGVGFVPLARTQGEHDTRYPVDREYFLFCQR